MLPYLPWPLPQLPVDLLDKLASKDVHLLPRRWADMVTRARAHACPFGVGQGRSHKKNNNKHTHTHTHSVAAVTVQITLAEAAVSARACVYVCTGAYVWFRDPT